MFTKDAFYIESCNSVVALQAICPVELLNSPRSFGHRVPENTAAFSCKVWLRKLYTIPIYKTENIYKTDKSQSHHQNGNRYQNHGSSSSKSSGRLNSFKKKTSKKHSTRSYVVPRDFLLQVQAEAASRRFAIVQIPRRHDFAVAMSTINTLIINRIMMSIVDIAIEAKLWAQAGAPSQQNAKKAS